MAKKKNPVSYKAACVKCGKLTDGRDSVLKNNINYCPDCAALPEPAGVMLLIPAGILKFLCYIVSFFSPPAGFALGAVYFSQQGKEQRSFAIKCFIFMGAGAVIIAFFFLIMSILGIADLSHAVSGTNTSDYNFTEDYY